MPQSAKMEQESAQTRQPLSEDEKDMLIRACNSDDINNLKQLIERLQLTPRDFNDDCSRAAIRGNHAQMIRYILEQKYIQVNGGMVEDALKTSAIQVLEVLKEFGWSDVNMSMGQVGTDCDPEYSEEPRTALYFATHDVAVVRYLLDRGANPNIGPPHTEGFGSTLAFKRISDSGAVLESAARVGDLETFDLLLAHGADLSKASAMHTAAERENIEIMAHLLKLGVDVDQIDLRYPYDTPLMLAMLSGRPLAVRFLLDHGASTLNKGYDRYGEIGPMDLVKRGKISDVDQLPDKVEIEDGPQQYTLWCTVIKGQGDRIDAKIEEEILSMVKEVGER